MMFYPFYQTPDGVAWEQTLQQYYPSAPDVGYFDPTKGYNGPGGPNRGYQCPAYVNLVPAAPYYSGYWDFDGWGGNSSYSYNIWGATHGSVELPELENCLGLGIDAPWLGDFINHTQVSSNLPARRDNQVTAPSQLFALMDSRGALYSGLPSGLQWTGWDWAAGYQGSPSVKLAQQAGWYAGYQSISSPPQHGKDFNVLFAEGHVEQVRLSYLFNPTNSARQWNVDNKPHPECWTLGP
jgi:hypothetical protein